MQQSKFKSNLQLVINHKKDNRSNNNNINNDNNITNNKDNKNCKEKQYWLKNKYQKKIRHSYCSEKIKT